MSISISRSSIATSRPSALETARAVSSVRRSGLAYTATSGSLPSATASCSAWRAPRSFRGTSFWPRASPSRLDSVSPWRTRNRRTRTAGPAPSVFPLAPAPVGLDGRGRFLHVQPPAVDPQGRPQAQRRHHLIGAPAALLGDPQPHRQAVHTLALRVQPQVDDQGSQVVALELRRSLVLPGERPRGEEPAYGAAHLRGRALPARHVHLLLRPAHLRLQRRRRQAHLPPPQP